MLKITSDGRKLGLDQRIVNQMLPDEPGTKVNQCVDNILSLIHIFKPHQAVATVDTASEALAVSISEKACVDMGYMSQLTGKTKGELAGELQSVIRSEEHTSELQSQR